VLHHAGWILLTMIPLINLSELVQPFAKTWLHFSINSPLAMLLPWQSTFTATEHSQKLVGTVELFQLENLLRTCRFLNVPIMSLIASSGPLPANVDAAKEAIARAGSRGVSLCQKKSEVRQALEKALLDPVPLSLSEVARRLGYKSTERLYQADRALCHKIAARHRQSGHSHWWKKPGAARICEVARLKEILEQSLKSINPASVHQIAAELATRTTDTFVRNFRRCARQSAREYLG